MKIFEITDDFTREGLLNGIEAIYPLLKTGENTIERHFYDTFDWRLYKNDLTVIKEANELTLRKLSTERTLAKLALTNTSKHKFWWNLPKGEMKSKLQSILDVRALLHICSVKWRASQYSLMDENDKTIARITFEEFTPLDSSPSDKMVELLRIRPLRGYSKQVNKLSELLGKSGLKNSRPGETEIAMFLRLTDAKPGEYSSKFAIDLDPNEHSGKAMKKILKNLLSTMEINLNGLKNDIDTEFLHDFRVSIRRTRSALSQIKNVLPKNKVKRFKKDFSYLGKLTNKTRDLDVYLLRRENYRSALPKCLYPGLHLFFNDLEAKRKCEFRKMVHSLESDKLKRIIEDWRKFLYKNKAQSNLPRNHSLPVRQVAGEFIVERFSQIIESAKIIDDDTADWVLHELRIECKKLRYLLEFFSSLYSKEKMIFLIKQLKKLQENLGDFNDLCVQQETMENYLENIDDENDDAIKISASLGGLIAVLHQRKLQVRSEFQHIFAKFADPKNKELFRELLKK